MIIIINNKEQCKKYSHFERNVQWHPLWHHFHVSGDPTEVKVSKLHLLIKGVELSLPAVSAYLGVGNLGKWTSQFILQYTDS